MRTSLGALCGLWDPLRSGGGVIMCGTKGKMKDASQPLPS